VEREVHVAGILEQKVAEGIRVAEDDQPTVLGRLGPGLGLLNCRRQLPSLSLFSPIQLVVAVEVVPGGGVSVHREIDGDARRPLLDLLQVTGFQKSEKRPAAKL